MVKIPGFSSRDKILEKLRHEYLIVEQRITDFVKYYEGRLKESKVNTNIVEKGELKPKAVILFNEQYSNLLPPVSDEQLLEELTPILIAQSKYSKRKLANGSCEKIAKEVMKIDKDGNHLADGYFFGHGIAREAFGFNDHAVSYKFVKNATGTFDLLFFDLTSKHTVGKGLSRFDLLAFRISNRGMTKNTLREATQILAKFYEGSWVDSSEKDAYQKTGAR